MPKPVVLRTLFRPEARRRKLSSALPTRCRPAASATPTASRKNYADPGHQYCAGRAVSICRPARALAMAPAAPRARAAWSPAPDSAMALPRQCPSLEARSTRQDSGTPMFPLRPQFSRVPQLRQPKNNSPRKSFPSRYPSTLKKARNQRIEGEVLLEVIFEANGKLRVLRVVRGLGHGLDEAAVHAAEQIRFKPALKDGQPSDSTAVLHIFSVSVITPRRFLCELSVRARFWFFF